MGYVQKLEALDVAPFLIEAGMLWRLAHAHACVISVKLTGSVGVMDN